MPPCVATEITACGFVTSTPFFIPLIFALSCNRDYRLRFCNWELPVSHCWCNLCCNRDYRLRFCNYLGWTDSFQMEVATEITACGFVTVNKHVNEVFRHFGCNRDYRLRFCNWILLLASFTSFNVATEITACGFVTWEWSNLNFHISVATEITACGFVTFI